MPFIKVEYFDDVTPLSAATFNDLQDRIQDAIAGIAGVDGVALYVQPTAPVGVVGNYAWFDTANWTLWIEDGT